MKRQQFISPGALQRMLQAAANAWNRRHFQEAIETMETASRRDPGNFGILLDLGRYYGLRYDPANAERCYEKALRLSPQKAKSLALAGANYQDAGNFDLAERYYLRSLEQKDAAPETFVQLAGLYERFRRKEDAAEMVGRALKLSPAHPGALLFKARLSRLAGRMEEAEQIIRSFITKPFPDAWTLAQTWYELGGILDRQGRYDDAIAAIRQAKIILYPHAAHFIYELKVVRQRVKAVQENITDEMLRRWTDCAARLAPPKRLTLLGGHPRSGTTLLEQVLDAHPDVVSLEETDVFHDEAYIPLQRQLPDNSPVIPFLESAQIPALQESRAGYFRSAELFLGQPIGSRLLIDKNPSLTFLIPGFIRVFPEIKLLIALRDPRDVVLSCFMQPIRLSQGSSAFLKLESAVDEYVAMMTLWQTLKPLLPGRYLEVRYEDMVEDLEPVARKTLGFLGVEWDARVLGFDEHARKKMVRSPTYADVTQPVYKRAVGRWQHYQKYLEPFLPKLEPFVKVFGYE